MEDYLLQRRQVTEQGSSEKEKAGGILFKITQNFIKLFERSRELKGQSALDRLQRILDLSMEQLNPIELKAMQTIITYLRGKKIK
jgi:hypothetical protein